MNCENHGGPGPNVVMRSVRESWQPVTARAIQRPLCSLCAVEMLRRGDHVEPVHPKVLRGRAMTLPEALEKAQVLARKHYKRAAVVVLRNPETDCIEVHVREDRVLAVSEEN